jgi:large subunit ribosomal protein L9
MKILLIEDVEGLGWLGDVVQVSSGYARNYLFPKRLAAKVDKANIEAIASEKARRAEQRQERATRLENAAAAVDGAEVVVEAKANKQGHLFGSVAGAQIAAGLREMQLLPPEPSGQTGGRTVVFEDGRLCVTDEVVQLPEHIKQVGTYPGVSIKFSEDVTAAVTVVVKAAEQTGAKAKNEEA